MMHSHHILPRNAPYLPELHHLKENAFWRVSLTVEGHACQHDVLYRAFGWAGDKSASDGLLGLVGKDDLHRAAAARGGRKGSSTRKQNGGYARDKMRSSPVVATHKITGEVRSFLSCIDCAEALGLYPSHVSECSRGLPKRKSTGGWIIRRAS